NLTIVGLTRPAVAVLGPKVDEQQHRRDGKTLNEAVEQRLSFWVNPVEVLEHDDEWLELALSAQETLDCLEGESSPLGRLGLPEAIVFGQRVEEPQNRRQHVLEHFVECEHVPGRLGADRSRIVAIVDPEERFEKIDGWQIADGPPIRGRTGVEHTTTDGGRR